MKKVKLTNSYFLKVGFEEIEPNNFKFSGYNNGTRWSLTILYNGIHWYFPKGKDDFHIYKYECDLDRFLKLNKTPI